MNIKDTAKKVSTLLGSLTSPEPRWLVLLDLALLVTALLLVFTDATVLLFHIVFLLLTIGAFFWGVRGFAVKSAFWVTLTTTVIILAVAGGQTQREELIEIPLLVAMLGVVFAISRERAKTEERYRRLFEATFEGVNSHQSGQVLDLNQAFEEMFGYAKHEVIKSSFVDYVATEFRDLVAQQISAQQPETFEAVGIKKDGSRLPIEIRSKVVPYQGRMVSVAAVRGITERIQSEQMKDEFLSIASQELRTPLTSMKGYIDLFVNGEL